MKTVWTRFKCEECECDFAIKEAVEDRVDEPCCPVCGENNCLELGTLEVLG